MSAESRWRKSAREVIERTLAALPAGAPMKQVRQALRNAYPFGTREHYPYKCWLIEQRAALKRLGVKRAAAVAPAIFYTLHNLDAAAGLPWLTVRCGWCNNRIAGGCMMCCRWHARVLEVVKDAQFQVLRRAVKDGDEVARAALGDWLEEQLGTRCGA